MRISDWSSDVCSSDLRFVGNSGGFGAARQDRQRVIETAQIEFDHNALMALLHQKLMAFRGQVFAHQFEFGFGQRSEEHTSELQSLMRISYAVFCLKKKKII